MAETIPADYLGRPGRGYLYAALLSAPAQAQLGEVIHSIHRQLGDEVMWPMPARALHITLMEIIQTRKNDYSHNKDQLFQHHQQLAGFGPRDIFAALGSFTVHFDTLVAYPDAIIARARDDGQFAGLRAELMAAAPIPTETKQPPNIIHSTIARYRSAVDLARVEAVVAEHSIDFTEPITEFRLLKTYAQSLLEFETLDKFDLADPGQVT